MRYCILIILALASCLWSQSGLRGPVFVSNAHVSGPPTLGDATFDLNPEAATINAINQVPAPLSGGSVNFTLLGGGYVANGSVFDYVLYSVKEITGVYHVNPNGLAFQGTDPNDAQEYQAELTASAWVDQTHWLLVKIGVGYRFDAVAGGGFAYNDTTSAAFTSGTYNDAVGTIPLVPLTWTDSDVHTDGTYIARAVTGASQALLPSPMLIGNCPIYREDVALLNVHDAIEFSQARLDNLLSSFTIPAAGWTVYVVWRPTVASTGLARRLIRSVDQNFLIGPYDGKVNCYDGASFIEGGGEGDPALWDATVVQCVSQRFDDPTRYTRVYTNGVAVGAEVSGGVTPGIMALGAVGYYPTEGCDILLARLMVFTGVHDSATVTNLSAELRNLYTDFP